MAASVALSPSAAPQSIKHPITAGEFFDLSAQENFYGDLIEGEVVEMTPPGMEHGDIAGNIFEFLAPFVRSHKLGRAYFEVGYIIERDPDTVLAPDIAFISEERLPKPIPKNFPNLVPDLAIEIISPGDRFAEIRDKAQRYLNAGVKEVWVVDPRRQAVDISRSIHETYTFQKKEILQTPLLPEFRLAVKDIFS